MQANALGFDGDAALLFQIHGIEHLRGHFALAERSGQFQQAIGKRRLAMGVDVSKRLDRAARSLERNRLEDAVEAYEAVLSEMPGHSEALQALGDLYTRLSQPDRALKYYGMVFDRFFEMHEENKALAIYTRALKGIQQPPARMARYALLLQKQNRPEEAVEQYSFASELFLAHGNREAALDCLERVAQLDPDDSGRQLAIAELAEQLGKNAIAAR